MNKKQYDLLLEKMDKVLELLQEKTTKTRKTSVNKLDDK